MSKYSRGKCICQITQQDYPLQVFETWRLRWLSFGSHYIQSVINKRKPHKPLLNYIKGLCLFCEHRPGNCLLLGLGGGALLHYLRHRQATVPITAVEVNPDIINIAQQYFYLDKIPKVRLELNDAYSFITSQASSKKLRYHHILIDLYGARDYPTQCASVQFFTHCRTLLHEQGILSLNLVNFKLQEHLLTTIKQVFQNQTLAVLIAGQSNILIHASCRPPMHLLARQLQNQGLIQSLEWNPRLGLTAEIK